MPAITDPTTMTVAERRTEVARILACGLVRSVRAARARASSPPAESKESGDLDGLRGLLPDVLRPEWSP